MSAHGLIPRNKGPWRSAILLRPIVAIMALPALASCGGATNALRPQGPAAAQIADLWWFMFWVAAVIFIGVMGTLGYALFRRREQAERPPQRSDGLGLIIGGGIVLPLVVITVLFGLTLTTLNALNAYARATALTIEVDGQQWWWEVRYPEQGIVTANEIHIPVGRPVRLELRSKDVVHNIWVPELNGKMDLIPNRVNAFWLQADQSGVYRGKCAEFCGTQHAMMAFVVVAEPEEQFQAWLAQQSQPAFDPTDPVLQQGKQIFLGSACVYCHTIRGTVASGKLGPDLTHLASRRTLGAGILDNNRGNLSGWIVNAQAIKPGNRMPPMYLDSESLHALIAYLESLE